MASRYTSAGTVTRDPVSELMDAGARRLLRRAYAARGQWVGTRLADPTPRHVVYFGAMGINVAGRDPVPGRAAKTRWARGFTRALYYQHKWYYAQGALGTSRRMSANHVGALQVEVGRRVPVLGVIPAGRAVRVRIRPGGKAALRAVARLPESARIYDADGRPGGAWTGLADRDW